MPCAFRSIVPASSRTASIGDPSRSARSSGGSARPSRSSAATSAARSPRTIPRPRRRPSIQSTSLRPRPEYGERRCAKSSGRSPPTHAKRSSDRRAWPYGVVPSPARPSNATGTPTAANAVPSASLTASTDGQTTAISWGGVPALTCASTVSATSSSVPRVPAPSSQRSEPSSGERRGVVGEQRPLDVRERRREELLGAWRELDHGLAGERGEIVDRPAERRVDGAAGLVGDRHVHLRARGERLEQAPLDAGEVLEAIREDRAVSPGPEIARQPLHGAAPKHAAVPSVDAVQLRAIRRRERGERLVEVTWLEQRAVQLCQRAPDGVREARETGAFGGRPGREPSDENASLGVTHEARARPLSPGEVLEERVERADRPGEQATDAARAAPARPARRRRAAGRSATDRGRALRRSGRGASRLCPSGPGRRRATDSPGQRSRRPRRLRRRGSRA